jgi:hypothetical protein
MNKEESIDYTTFDKVLILSSFIKNFVKIEKYFIDKLTSKNHVIKLSLLNFNKNNNKLSQLHLETEKEIIKKNIPYTIIRSNFCFQTFSYHTYDNIDLVNELALIGNAKISWIDIRDLSDCLYKIITTKNETHHYKTYNLSGKEEITLLEINKMIMNLTDSCLTFVYHYDFIYFEDNEWSSLKTNLFKSCIDGGYSFVTEDVFRITEKQPRDMYEYLSEEKKNFISKNQKEETIETLNSSEKRIKMLKEFYRNQENLKDIILFLRNPSTGVNENKIYKSYKNCFSGVEFVTLLLKNCEGMENRYEANEIFREFLQSGYIEEICKEEDLYKFLNKKTIVIIGSGIFYLINVKGFQDVQLPNYYPKRKSIMLY